MTPIHNAAATSDSAQTAEVEQFLRDAAYVLKLIRRVKTEMIRDAAGPRRAAAASLDGAPAVLGV